jgi:hypothetical protein
MASFNRKRRCIRCSEAAIAGVMFSPNRIGNSRGDEFRFFTSGEGPLMPGEALAAPSEAFGGVSRCRALPSIDMLMFGVTMMECLLKRLYRPS